MNSGDRVRAMIAIWVLGGIMIISTAPAVGQVAVFPFVGIIGAAMLIISLALMFVRPPQEQSSHRRSEESYRRDDRDRDEHRDRANFDKAKRSDMALVERLLDTMSDAELAALQRRLSGSPTERSGYALGEDGEIVPNDGVERRGRHRSESIADRR